MCICKPITFLKQVLNVTLKSLSVDQFANISVSTKGLVVLLENGVALEIVQLLLEKLLLF